MDYEPQNFARSVGLKSISDMGDCTATELRVELRVCIRYMALSFEPYVHCRGQTLMCSLPRLALQQHQLGSCEWFSEQAKLLNWSFRFIRIC
jgi:hypothetical protein